MDADGKQLKNEILLVPESSLKREICEKLLGRLRRYCLFAFVTDIKYFRQIVGLCDSANSKVMTVINALLLDFSPDPVENRFALKYLLLTDPQKAAKISEKEVSAFFQPLSKVADHK